MSRVVIFVCLLMLASAVVSLDLPGGFKTPSELPKVPDTPSLPDTSKLPDKKVPDLPKDAGTKV
ncbi:hypothetical protein ABMA27_005987 [Loxostege sticticalis]|uniref:Uncharacterized protein n=1 Tax=Loxostege sticticalis TaxID=481309 RepID=A0ABR3HH69_LOXSC